MCSISQLAARIGLLCAMVLPSICSAGPTAIVIHGGAGTIERDKMSAEIEARYRKTLTEAVSAGPRFWREEGAAKTPLSQRSWSWKIHPCLTQVAVQCSPTKVRSNSMPPSCSAKT